jgi:hypothetical protein
MAQGGLLETLMWVNIQRITGVAHCANVVWRDLANYTKYKNTQVKNTQYRIDYKIALRSSCAEDQPLEKGGVGERFVRG